MLIQTRKKYMREVVCQPLVWPDFVEKLVTTDCHSVVVSYEV
jgi:hypothetical protein